MDGWQAVQNWIIFGAIAAGAVYYYYPQSTKNKVAKPIAQAVNRVVPETKPTTQKKKNASQTQQKSSKKNVQIDTPITDVVAEEKHEKATEDSNRAFAQSMLKARQGVEVKKTQTNAEKVKTVKPKTSQTLASPPSVAESDDGDWSQVTSSQVRSSGVEDMLEAQPSGPSTLRITASERPVREQKPKQVKQEQVETKKQRQNRQKVEQRQAQRQEEEKDRKALEEKQRRTAREARGEPARNGLAVAPAPTSSAWNGSAPAATNASQSNHTLLDTFDAESTSSSNDAQVSTAATSTTDGATAQWHDEPFQPDDLTKSMIETGPWNEVKKKSKKKNQGSDGNTTPINAASSSSNGGLNKTKHPVTAAPATKSTGFAALKDEAEQSNDGLDPNDASNW